MRTNDIIDSVKNIKRLRGGSFNLRYGRPKETVKREVIALLRKHNLDFLAVQEAADYFRVLGTIPGYKYFSHPTERGQQQNGILVRETLKTSRPAYAFFGDGWFTEDGHEHEPTTFPRVSVEWLRVGAMHAPVPIYFNEKGPYGPEERVDDYLVLMKRVIRYFKIGTKKSRIVVGDWNEPLTTKHPWSPAWVAAQSKAVAVDTVSREGFGRIDYPMGKNVRFENVRKDTEITEGSDHEPVLFDVVKV